MHLSKLSIRTSNKVVTPLYKKGAGDTTVMISDGVTMELKDHIHLPLYLCGTPRYFREYLANIMVHLVLFLELFDIYLFVCAFCFVLFVLATVWLLL